MTRESDGLAQRLAQHLQGTKAAFENAFTLAQQRANKTPAIDFKLVGTSLDDRSAIAQGFAHALKGGWVNALVIMCFEQRLAQEALLEEFTRGPVRRSRRRTRLPTAELQGILGPNPRFVKVGPDLSGRFRLYRQTCRILVSGDPRGTGVLVGANLVLTAWHVVRDLLDTTTTAPKPGSEHQITVEFDEVRLTKDEPVHPTLKCEVSATWLVSSSPCHPDELGRKLPKVADLRGLNDYAVIQLAAMPGSERGFLDLTHTADASATSMVYVFQHPRGVTLRLTDGAVKKMYGLNRFFHLADTLDGSSGAPCVDSEFRFVGLHQAGVVSGTTPTPKSTNRGVPITAFLEDLKTRLAPAPTQSIWQLKDPETPVIGRDDFQATIWSAAMASTGSTPAPQLIAVIGTPHSEQVVCQRLLEELLPAASERLISVSAGSLPASPEELIRKIAGATGEPDPAALSLPSGSDPGTTEARWIRNQLVPAFRTAIAKHAVQRRIWLVITDLDLHTIPQGAVREFLAEVYEQIRSMPWLRVVLFGFEDSVPPKALPVYRPIRLVPPTQTHLSHYIARRFGKELSQQESEETAAWLWQQAQEELAANKVELADALRTVVGRLKVATLGGQG